GALGFPLGFFLGALGLALRAVRGPLRLLCLARLLARRVLLILGKGGRRGKAEAGGDKDRNPFTHLMSSGLRGRHRYQSARYASINARARSLHALRHLREVV